MLLDFQETKKILDKYNIPLVKTEVINSERQGFDFASRNGWPVVLKVFSPKILHRTELGLVKNNIKNEVELKSSFCDILKKSDKLKNKKILIQTKAKGTEIICGMKRDSVFGPVLLFGLGGIFVEVLKDVSFGIAPLKEKDALQMIKEIKGYKILKGYRKYPEVDLKKISKLLINLSRLSLEEKRIKEIDFNPVFVGPKKIEAVDFKIII